MNDRAPVIIAPHEDAFADKVCEILQARRRTHYELRSIGEFDVTVGSSPEDAIRVSNRYGDLRSNTVAWVLFRGYPSTPRQSEDEEYLRDEWFAALAPLVSGGEFVVANSPFQLGMAVRPLTNWGIRSWLRTQFSSNSMRISSTLSNMRAPGPTERAFLYPDMCLASPAGISRALGGEGLLALHKPSIVALWFAVIVAGKVITSGMAPLDSVAVPHPLSEPALRLVSNVVHDIDLISVLWIAECNYSWTLVGYDPFPAAALFGDFLTVAAERLVNVLDERVV